MASQSFSFKSVCCIFICLSAILWIPTAGYADGELDTTFDPGTGPNSYVYAVAVQPDGKIVIGGAFTSVNGISRNGIARLNADGSLDEEFDPGYGASSAYVSAVAVQSDGTVLIGGGFSTFNSISRKGIARLNSNGSLDMTFDPGSGATHVYSIVLQPDGNLLIGGTFSSVNGMSRYGIARLNANGSLDVTFDPGKGTGGYDVSEAVLQSDGKVIIVGKFTTVNSISRNRIARLNSNGFLDMSFDPGLIGPNDDIVSAAVQSDGKILIGGKFTTFNNIIRPKVARLNADGSLDTSFDPKSGANDDIWSNVLVQSDGKILIGGKFTTFNGTERKGIARLNSDGSLDTNFDIGSGVGTLYSTATVEAMKLQSDGKILIVGSFTKFNEILRSKIARLTSNASISAVRSFSPSCYFPGTKITVTLTTAPLSGTTNYLVEETLPTGGTVSNISNSGIYDSSNKKIKFGPFFELDTKSLTYDLTFPSTDSSDKTFAGKAFTDKAILSITGQRILTPCLEYHPADIDENFILSANEAAAYGAAWKRGMTWESPPNPIPIAYVTRAGALWNGGETYKIDTSLGDPPLCWINKKKRSLRDETPNAESSAVRDCLSACLTGQPLTVTLTVKPADTVKSYAVEEDMPPGWTFGSVGDSGEFDAVNNKVKFGFFPDSEVRTLTYQIKPTATAAGEAVLNGVASFDGKDLKISGTGKVTVEGGDIDGDGKSDLADVIIALKILVGLDDFSLNPNINGDKKIGLEDALYILQKISM
jgi:uncharacterized delta-60 repeat protein